MTTEPAVDAAEQSGLASWSVLERLGRILHVREADASSRPSTDRAAAVDDRCGAVPG